MIKSVHTHFSNDIFQMRLLAFSIGVITSSFIEFFLTKPASTRIRNLHPYDFNAFLKSISLQKFILNCINFCLQFCAIFFPPQKFHTNFRTLFPTSGIFLNPHTSCATLLHGHPLYPCRSFTSPQEVSLYALPTERVLIFSLN